MTMDINVEPADLVDPDLDDLIAKHERYVQGLLDARDELLDQRRHRAIALEVIEQELRSLGIEL